MTKETSLELLRERISLLENRIAWDRKNLLIEKEKAKQNTREEIFAEVEKIIDNEMKNIGNKIGLRRVIKEIAELKEKT